MLLASAPKQGAAACSPAHPPPCARARARATRPAGIQILSSLGLLSDAPDPSQLLAWLESRSGERFGIVLAHTGAARRGGLRCARAHRSAPRRAALGLRKGGEGGRPLRKLLSCLGRSARFNLTLHPSPAPPQTG